MTGVTPRTGIMWLNIDEQRIVCRLLEEIQRRGYDLTPGQQQLLDRLHREEIGT
jgi:hypothetical protein